MTGLIDLGIAEAAEALARGDTSSVELTRAAIARAEAVNPRLNCFISIEAEDALAAAANADAERKAGKVRGPLHGVPLAHKDMFYRAGKPCTGGTEIRRKFVASTTSTVAARLDAAGAVWLGNLNMSEFAANPAGHNYHFGHCRNAWNRDYISGGSSSGSGSAVAARACFGALGSDTGGSIRLPSSICGVVGLKPTYGLVSRWGALPRSWALDTIGPLTRTVRDCALMTAAIAGRDPLDPTTADLPVPDYAAKLEGGIAGLRIGIPRSFFFDDLAPSVRQALDQALAVLKDLGARTVEVDLPEQERLFNISDAVGKSEAATMHGRWIRERPNDYSQFVRNRMETGFHLPATRYLEAMALRGRILTDFVNRAFAEADLLFTPGVGIEVPRLSESEPASPVEGQKLIVRLTRCTRSINYLGVPSLTVPAGFTANGMPTGFQLIGRPFSEALLFRAGHSYQGATDWHKRKPAE